MVIKFACIVAMVMWFVCDYLDKQDNWKEGEGIVSYKKLLSNSKVQYTASILVKTKFGKRAKTIKSIPYNSNLYYRTGDDVRVLYKMDKNSSVFKFKDYEKETNVTYDLLKSLYLSIALIGSACCLVIGLVGV
jgi:hypothetical protein